MFSLRHEQFLAEQVRKGICTKCKQPDDTVAIQYSYGVFAGVMCDACARSGYRDQCGLRPEGQGTKAEYEELSGPGSYDGDEEPTLWEE